MELLAAVAYQAALASKQFRPEISEMESGCALDGLRQRSALEVQNWVFEVLQQRDFQTLVAVLTVRRFLGSKRLVTYIHLKKYLTGNSPFSSRILSSNEFLYRSIKHSSAAVRWLCCRDCRPSSLRLMVASKWRMYSVRRSRKAAWACLFRCFRSSDVA